MMTTELLTWPAEQRVTLQNISWQFFEAMLNELGIASNARLAYDQGNLEIMSPLFAHEHIKRLLERCVETLCEELNLPIRSAGSLTCKRQDLLKGIEPDSCFYIQTEPLIRHLQNIDLERDSPPDLILEVDFSNSSLNKEPIQLALGIPEVWRYAGGHLTIKRLQQGQSGENQYRVMTVSPTFNDLPLIEIPQFLGQSSQLGEAGVIRAFRQWVKSGATRMPPEINGSEISGPENSP